MNNPDKSIDIRNNMISPKAAIFLDRDGTINLKRDDYVKIWSEFEFLPGVLEAMRYLANLPDLLIFVVTNQSCIKRGLTTLEKVEAIHHNMIRTVESNGGRIDDIAICPHLPDEGCNCRKPESGMLLTLAKKHSVSLPASYLIGDSLSDIQAARRVGTKAIWITDKISFSSVSNDLHIYRAQDFPSAVEQINHQYSDATSKSQK